MCWRRSSPARQPTRRRVSRRTLRRTSRASMAASRRRAATPASIARRPATPRNDAPSVQRQASQNHPDNMGNPASFARSSIRALLASAQRHVDQSSPAPAAASGRSGRRPAPVAVTARRTRRSNRRHATPSTSHRMAATVAPVAPAGSTTERPPTTPGLRLPRYTLLAATSLLARPHRSCASSCLAVAGSSFAAVTRHGRGAVQW